MEILLCAGGGAHAPAVLGEFIEFKKRSGGHARCFTKLECSVQLESSGASEEHCRAMQTIGAKVLWAHDEKTKSMVADAGGRESEVDLGWASHGEKHQKLLSGRYSIYAGTTPAGSPNVHIMCTSANVHICKSKLQVQ